MSDNPRRYVAVSIKHTEYKWQLGKPLVFWGYHRTEDDEPRCFCGYTMYLDNAERYALGDFRKKGYIDVLDENSVPLSIDFRKKWKKYDTVLLDEADAYSYYRLLGLPMKPEDENDRTNTSVLHNVHS